MSTSLTEIEATVRLVLEIGEDQPLSISPINRGGSARVFFRVRYGLSSRIFMRYDRDRRENNYYADQARFLREIGVSAPRIFHHDAAAGIIVMEDLGAGDLWHYRQTAWDSRRPHYFRTLDMIRKMHVLGPGDPALAGLSLMEAFGFELYRWEREYFRQHFVCGVCRLELHAAEAEALEEELALLAARLAARPSGLIHRDLQSQNVMICNNQPVLIDFQGMRYGDPCYDLGSLLYDPYVHFTAAEREELLRYYYSFCRDEYDLDLFREMFRQASVQRLMQALGAYGFLGQQEIHRSFLAHIPSGLANLLEALGDDPQLCLLKNLALRCREALAASGLWDR